MVRMDHICWQGLMAMTFVLVFCTTGCSQDNGEESQPPPQPPPPTVEAQSSQTAFAQYYQPQEVTVNPAAPGYSLPLDLGNIVNQDVLRRVSPQAQELLTRNGFVVIPRGRQEEIAEVYDDIEDADIPVFVTADSLLHIYHIQFDEALKDIEEHEFYDDLITLSRALRDDSRTKYQQFSGDLKEAAGRNWAFFFVGWLLLNPVSSEAPSPPVQEQCRAELQLIEAHQGFTESPIFKYKEDYSQYVPRGHYTRSEKLKWYFKAMMWYGRMAFLLKGQDLADDALISAEDARIQTLQACLIAHQLYQQPELAEIWNRIYHVTAFFVGTADDLTPYEYKEAIEKVYGTAFAWNELADEAKLLNLKGELASLRSPQIYGGTGDIVVMPPFTAEKLAEKLDKTKGLRLMGQRFIPDSYMFQQLVFPSTALFTGQGQPFTLSIGPGGPVRGFPRGLDVMLVMGSQRAEDILEAAGDTDYERYDEKLAELKEMFTAFTPAQWNRNLYWGWLYALQALIEERGEGYPNFMLTDAWQDRQLNAALASWAELRHDTILYAKQSYTMITMAPPPPPAQPPPGYVEPVPEFYGRLLTLTQMTLRGLGDMDVLDEQATSRLKALEDILQRLVDISQRELANEELTEEDYRFIRYFGSRLEGVTRGVEEAGSKTTIIADVHTDGNTRQVLEEGVGYVQTVAVAYQLPDGRVALGMGPVLSYYEFKHPMADRLTDEAWRELLKTNPPAPPEWTASFRVQ